MGDQFTEYAGALPAPIAQNAGNSNLRVVVQNRNRNTAEEGKGRDMPVAKSLGRLARIGLHETAIRLRQIHHQEMDLAFNAANYAERFAKIHLSMAWRMRQGHEHLALTLFGRKNIILHDRDASSKLMFITQPLEHPFRCMFLLATNLFISIKDLIDNPDEPIKLRASRRLTPPVARRKRKRQHFVDSPSINGEHARRFPTAHAFNQNRMTNPSI